MCDPIFKSEKKRTKKVNANSLSCRIYTLYHMSIYLAMWSYVFCEDIETFEKKNLIKSNWKLRKLNWKKKKIKRFLIKIWSNKTLLIKVY